MPRPSRRRKITPGSLVANGEYHVSTDGAASQTRRKIMAGHGVPDVALLRVFDFVRLATPSPTKTGWTWPWQSLAQVCHRWRQLILSSPERLRLDFRITHGAPVPSILRIPFISALDIDYCNHKYTDIWGSESESESEDSFNYDDNDDNDDRKLLSWSRKDTDGVSLAFKDPGHIRSINLLAYAGYMRGLFTSMSSTLPKLESLRLHAVNKPWSSDIFPHGFRLGKVAPALRLLSLTGITTPLPSAPNITHFEFALEWDLPNAPSSFLGELVKHVCQMSQLESLILRFEEIMDLEVDIESVPPPPTQAPTIFPVLSEFTYEGLSIYLEAFTCRIVAPALTSLNIQFEDDTVVAVPSLTSFIDGGSRLRVPTVVAHLELSRDHRGCFKAYSSPQDLTAPFITFRQNYVAEVNGPPGVSVPPVNSIAWLCHHIAPALSSAETLIIKHDGDPRLDDPGARWVGYMPEWHMFLAAFTGVRHMAVENIFALAIARVLGRPGGVHLLPNLHDLRFLFYSTDGHNPSDILVELEPYTGTTAHTGRKHALDVFCKTIPRKGQHPELKTGVVHVP
ncbi:hypothetical protein BC834DRAFT_1045586 [Gloeopeniophorella convolvens]|nr:hypothetical protein BC834DRAFT_1045586 [Gloeopeniophorella convolvens]